MVDYRSVLLSYAFLIAGTTLSPFRRVCLFASDCAVFEFLFPWGIKSVIAYSCRSLYVLVLSSIIIYFLNVVMLPVANGAEISGCHYYGTRDWAVSSVCNGLLISSVSPCNTYFRR